MIKGFNIQLKESYPEKEGYYLTLATDEDGDEEIQRLYWSGHSWDLFYDNGNDGGFANYTDMVKFYAPLEKWIEDVEELKDGVYVDYDFKKKEFHFRRCLYGCNTKSRLDDLCPFIFSDGIYREAMRYHFFDKNEQIGRIGYLFREFGFMDHDEM